VALFATHANRWIKKEELRSGGAYAAPHLRLSLNVAGNTRVYIIKVNTGGAVIEAENFSARCERSYNTSGATVHAFPSLGFGTEMIPCWMTGSVT
jgi:hypothetical protein